MRPEHNDLPEDPVPEINRGPVSLTGFYLVIGFMALALVVPMLLEAFHAFQR